MQPNALLEAALQYAGRGWHVFPLGPRSKKPLIPKRDGGRGFKDATIARDQIERWWSACPTANIGIATGHVSGLLVIDLDGLPGLQAFQAVVRKHEPGGVLPSTLVAVTGRGWHIYWTLPRISPRMPCSSSDGIDVRGDGGYVVAPPSIHPSGFQYYWSDELRDDGTNPPPRVLPWAS